MTDLRLPRSVTAALWLPHVRDLGSVTRAAAAITGDDEPHVAVTGRAQLNLAALFAGWSPITFAAAALPVPGSPGGVPAAATADAVEAGECLVVAGRDGSWVAVPRVRRFGSSLEPGSSVAWHVVPAPGAEQTVMSAVGTLTEARESLVRGLAAATDALTRLDVARWRPDAAAQIAGLLTERTPDWPLPAEIGPERTELLARAARLLAIVRLARQSEAAAVTAWAADQRTAALQEVESAARKAMSAATAYARSAVAR
jgi:hypothetical protein